MSDETKNLPADEPLEEAVPLPIEYHVAPDTRNPDANYDTRSNIVRP